MSEAITAPDATAGAAAVPAAAPAAPAPPADSPTAGGAPNDWRATLPADLAEHAKRFPDAAAAVKAHLEAEKLIGRKGIIPPKEGDPPEVAAAYRAALGVPEKPEGYAFTKPDGVPDAVWTEDGLGKLRAWAHELGLTPAQAQGFGERLAKAEAEAVQRLAEGIEPDGRKMDDVLREEWGAGYDGKIELAKRAAKQFGDDAAITALEARVGGSALMRMFARIGEALAEDAPAGMGTGSGGAPDPSAELRRYYEPGTPENAAYTQKLHPKHMETMARVKALFAAGAKL